MLLKYGQILLFGLISLVIINEILCECGYQSCKDNDPEKLNIHIVAHTHDDVGWLKTVDGYYFDDVQHIFTNVVNALNKNQKRKFTQVETYYFNRWWSEQNNQTRALVHKLVASGQLSFANGGYTVNDEGVAHYSDIIDQMTFGINILEKIFGKCGKPVISWQIDPFGASKEMSSLYAQMGFDGHVFNRGVFPKGEFIWRGSPDLGEKSEIFTTILHNHYSAPNGFDFEDGNDINNQNRRKKAEEVVNLAKQWNKDFGNTNQVLIPFGDDFKFKNAEHYFDNLDKLLSAVKEFHPEVNMFYSNPMCYLLAVHQTNRAFSLRERDYFPLWSGFFSSRPSLKGQVRTTNNLLQISKQLDALTRIPENEPYINEGKNEVAIMTHHDAITGTSPKITVDDYTQRLFSGSNALKEVVNRIFAKLLPKEETIKTIPKQIFCDGLNISQCIVSENNEEFTLIIYNPIGRPVSQWVRVPVSSNHNFEVFNSNGIQIKEVHSIPIAEGVLKIPGRQSIAKFELVFAVNIQRMGFQTYFLKKTNNPVSNPSVNTTSIQLKGKGFVLSINHKTGEIEKIKLSDGKEFPLKQSFKFYKSNVDQSYIFCSEGNVNNIDTKELKLESFYKKGSISEVKQHWNSWISQTIRVYEDQEYIELDWVVGPLPINDNIGKEVITRFETDFNTKGVFYTDGNGRQNIKRTRTMKQEKCGSFSNNIANNYYPIYGKAFIRDEQKGVQMTVLNDRAQGGSSLTDGQLEFMVHRRLLTDKNIPLNETGPDGKGIEIRGKHFVFFKPISDSAKAYRDLNQRLFMSPLITFSHLTQSRTDYQNKYKTSYSGLNRDLPPNVHLLTLEKWSQNEILVRFEHFYQIEDKNDLSKTTQIDLQNLFKFNIKSIRETTLSANQLLSESNRLKWKTNHFSNKIENNFDINFVDINNMKIELSPQQIRTFILTVEDHNQRVPCSLQWKIISGSKIPENAIIGGFDIDSKSLYICRHKQNNDLIPGKANERLGCVVTIDGKKFTANTNYEVLIGHNYYWVQRHGGDAVPDRAFIAGQSGEKQLIYVGRCDLHIGRAETEVVGKIHHKFYYAFGETEHEDCYNHQIMVC